MNATRTLSLVCAIAIAISGCCLKFNDLNPGTTYNVGSTITTGGKVVKIEHFQWSNGNWTSSGHARVTSNNQSGGAGYDVNANNVNLNFQLDYPVKKLTLKFADYGGNENIKINNSFRNVQNLLSLNNTAVGGVDVSVNAIQAVGSTRGFIELKGNINGFTIGGQELWIDDVCIVKWLD